MPYSALTGFHRREKMSEYVDAAIYAGDARDALIMLILTHY